MLFISSFFVVYWCCSGARCKQFIHLTENICVAIVSVITSYLKFLDWCSLEPRAFRPLLLTDIAFVGSLYVWLYSSIQQHYIGSKKCCVQKVKRNNCMHWCILIYINHKKSFRVVIVCIALRTGHTGSRRDQFGMFISRELSLHQPRHFSFTQFSQADEWLNECTKNWSTKPFYWQQ